MPYFRPLDATFEASDIYVYANIFVGSVAPIAFVGCTGCDVINNTIVFPEKWVMRILQETVDPRRFVACGNNSFQNNLIYLGDISTATNIGPNTEPQSFILNCNFWYNFENEVWEGPFTPVIDRDQVINENPNFVDIDDENYKLQPSSPAAHGINYTGDPENDYNGNTYHIPRSFGAFEQIESDQVESHQSLAPFCKVFPNPGNATVTFQYILEDYSDTKLEIYTLDGKLVETVEEFVQAPGEYWLDYDCSDHASGMYVFRFYRNEQVQDGRFAIIK